MHPRGHVSTLNSRGLTAVGTRLMSQFDGPATQRLTIVAQDPGVREDGGILLAQVDVPAERLAPGPRGYRVHVIDYDATSTTLYRPAPFRFDRAGVLVDEFESASNAAILRDPRFHAQNVYTIVMRTLARFEFALGRRVSWAFEGHQIKVIPHAFADANAFYSEHDEALMFGYFAGRKGNVFTCLSHDVIAHETTHAILDGLRSRYTDPSSPDQGAFHEGFADLVALLSVFSLRNVVEAVLGRHVGEKDKEPTHPRFIHERALGATALRESLLFGLAEQMGQELSAVRGSALRQSATLHPSPRHLGEREFQEPHRRGEVLVAAVLNAFIDILVARFRGLRKVRGGYMDGARVAAEAAEAADYLLTMVIRAIDYTPATHIEFGDFLSAVLTADHEIRPLDEKYHFRDHLRASFGRYGIKPASRWEGEPETGLWERPAEEMDYRHVHFEPMTRDTDEMFRFVWENRRRLGLSEDAYTRVESLRPCLRIAPDDGFPLRETVAECTQILNLEARELKRVRLEKPEGMPDDTPLKLSGGITLIFDEFGRLKFAIGNRLDSGRQQTRLQHLWDVGHYRRSQSGRRQFSAMHRARAMDLAGEPHEEW